jgi:hypothetical protein
MKVYILMFDDRFKGYDNFFCGVFSSKQQAEKAIINEYPEDSYDHEKMYIDEVIVDEVYAK